MKGLMERGNRYNGEGKDAFCSEIHWFVQNEAILPSFEKRNHFKSLQLAKYLSH